MKALETYRYAPIGWRTLPLFAVGLAAAAAAGSVDALFGGWLGSALALQIALTVAFAVGVGIIAFYVLEWGRCRNTLAARAIAAALALAAISASHYFGYYRAALQTAKRLGTPAAAVRDRYSFGAYMTAQQESGVRVANARASFGLGGWAVRAGWAIEALVVLGFALAGGAIATLGIHCSRCDGPTRELGRLRLGGLGEGDAAEALRSGDLDAVLALQARSAEELPRLELAVAGCPSCEETAFVTVSAHRVPVAAPGGSNATHSTHSANSINSTNSTNSTDQKLPERVILTAEQRRAFVKRCAAKAAATA
jgi:hypothetical protein